MNNLELLEMAKKMIPKAYAPYSNFRVGAALLCSDGSVYTGCNIENAAYSPTICAERSAVCCAICDGHKDFVKIAVVSDSDKDSTSAPCGVCRQVLYEFNPEIIVVEESKNDKRGYIEYKLNNDLLPHAFGPENL